MKSIHCIFVSFILLLLPFPMAACYSPYYEPGEYLMFRISPNYLRSPDRPVVFNYDSEENCLLWQMQTGTQASLDEIYQVVYKSSIEEFCSLFQRSSQIDTNIFVRTLRGDPEAAAILLLAKQCEKARSEMASPWYYPTKQDCHKLSLEQVAEQAMNYRSSRFQSRYALQAVRALLTLRRYDECINYWNSVKDGMDEDVVSRMALRYVAGAYYNIGQEEIAKHLYAKAGDVESLLNAAHWGGQTAEETIYRYYPESKELREWVERVIRRAELQGEGDNLDYVRDFSLKLGREGRVSDPALWYYCAAFIYHLQGNDLLASQTLAKAEKSEGSVFVHESIRVFRIYLYAVLTPYSSTYEAKMVDQLNWLDNKIVASIGNIVDDALDVMWSMNGNRSLYYWNDMWRKIILSAICPKLISHHREAHAIAFANMADNRVLSLLPWVESENGKYYSIDQYRKSRLHNYHDYRTSTFEMADTLSIESLVAYARLLETPKTRTEKYLCDHGYSDPSFVYDIIGTRMIREMRYEEAERWLSSVPVSFQQKLNTYKDGYFEKDPFSLTNRSLSDNGDYKYSFVREMASLEKEIARTSDPDRKARMMVKLATGMKNSVTSCWALSFYRKSESDVNPYPEGAQTLFLLTQANVLARANDLFDEALRLSSEPEVSASILLAYGNIRTLMKTYPETASAQYAKTHCDTYWDYHLDRYYRK